MNSFQLRLRLHVTIMVAGLLLVLFTPICDVIWNLVPQWILALPWILYAATTLTEHFIEMFVNADNIKPDGKAVLVTGCDTGFGHLLAKRLDAKGFKVFACCLNPDSEDSQRLRKECSSEIRLVKVDVSKDSDLEECEALVRTELQQCNRELWGVVANAGIEVHGWFEWNTKEDLARIVDINLMGVIRTTRTFLPLLKESRGRLVLLGSIAARQAVPQIVVYSMTKAAVASMADGLRRELSTFGVTAHSIEPAFYRTEMFTRKQNSDLNILQRWKELPESLQKSYGERRLKKSQALFRLVQRITLPDISEPVQAMEHAIEANCPKTAYSCSTYFGKFSIRLLNSVLPVEYSDWCHKYPTISLGFLDKLKMC